MRATALPALVVLLGVAEAAPRGRFAQYLDPALVQRPAPSPRPLSVRFVIPCTTGSSTWLAAMRLRLARVLGTRTAASISMQVVLDCASGNQAEVVECEASLVPITPPRPDELVIDARCRVPTNAELAAAISGRRPARPPRL